MKVHELVGHTLARLGARHCFGVVGSGNFHVTNALIAAGVGFTAARHESGATTMADAFARLSGTVGLVSVHQGCGLTNTATGLGEAAKSRTPLLVLAAENTASAVHSNFAMDQPGLARSVGAASDRVHCAASALDDVVRAFRTASHQRRAVLLNLPLDVQAADVPDEVIARLGRLEPLPDTPKIRPSQEAVTAFARLLANSERPVFIAGRGARAAGPQLRRLADFAGALLSTSAVANGLFHGDPFNLGISGGFASPTSAALIADADLVVGFGCALNMWTMRRGRLIGADTTVVQVDVEDSALGAHRPIDLGVVGDAGATADDALTVLADVQAVQRLRYRTEAVRARIARAAWIRQPVEKSLSTSERIDPRLLTATIDAVLPIERVVAIDSGNFMGYPSVYLRVPDEFGFCMTQAFQSIGLGLSTAIGAALAQPDRLPVLGTGDGGFLMSIAELETAVRLRLPVVCIVYNDAAYGAEVHHFGGPGAPPVDLSTVTFPDTDIAALARGFGATGITVRELADLDQVWPWLNGDRATPLVIDAKIASDGGSWWLAEAFKGH